MSNHTVWQFDKLIFVQQLWTWQRDIWNLCHWNLLWLPWKTVKFSLSLFLPYSPPPPPPHTLPPPYHPSFSFLAQTLNNPLKHLEKSSRGLPWNISDCHVWHTLARENNFTHEWAKISRSVSLLFILWSSFATCFHAVKFIFSWGTGKGLVFFLKSPRIHLHVLSRVPTIDQDTKCPESQAVLAVWLRRAILDLMRSDPSFSNILAATGYSRKWWGKARGRSRYSTLLLNSYHPLWPLAFPSLQSKWQMLIGWWMQFIHLGNQMLYLEWTGFNHTSMPT